MKKASLVVQKPYQNNEIFRPDSPLNRDNCLQFFHDLKSQLKALGVELVTQDQVSEEEAQFILYSEIPVNLTEVRHPEKSSVMLFESELIIPQNWNPSAHKLFKYIFTWNDSFVDNKKYFKFNFAHAGQVPFKKFSEKTKFCTLIAGNKKVTHPLELYSKRVETIRWFEKNHPDQFEFYGVGWDMKTFKGKFAGRLLNRIKFLRKILSETYPSYKGKIQDKLLTLQNYKFSICYENAEKIPGYITEKIFDSMAAGCIPVYWGALNIRDFIPEICFIDCTKFKTDEELYAFLTSMSELEYNARLEAIAAYLKSPQHKAYEPEYNAAVVAQRLAHV